MLKFGLQVLFVIFLIAVQGCENNPIEDLDKDMLIISGTSIGPYCLGDKVSGQTEFFFYTEESVRIDVGRRDMIRALYTENEAFHFSDDYTPIGHSFKSVKERFGKGRFDSQGELYVGTPLYLFEGVFVTIDNDRVKGVGVWSDEF